ncbi:MAG: hypothetical protein RIC56_06065 [Pseudomonadales bacterium]
MPIVDLELVTAASAAEALSADGLRDLADSLGEIFASPPQGTWVRVRCLDPIHYAENARDQPVFPVFVTVLKSRVPDPEVLAAEMRRVAAAVAAALARPVENVHVLYQPQAIGRIGFGGELLKE